MCLRVVVVLFLVGIVFIVWFLVWLRYTRFWVLFRFFEGVEVGTIKETGGSF